MNRETKRLLAKQEAQAERERARSMPLPGSNGGRGRGGGSARTREGGRWRRRGPSGAGGASEEREGRLARYRRFLKEVRVELKKVAWPSRTEVLTYTVVVLVSVTFVTLLVFGLDFGFGKAVLHFFND